MGFFKQSVYLAGARLADKAASLVLVLVVSRRFGEEGLGEFNYFFALGSLFLPLIDMGMGMILLQRWHQRDEHGRRALMTQLLILKLTLGLTALGGAMAADALNHGGHANPAAVFAAFLALYFDSFCDFVRRPAQARGVVWIEAVFPLISRAVQLAGLFYFMNYLTNGFQIIYIYAASSAMELALSTYGMRGCWPVRLRAQEKENWAGLLASGFPFAMSGFFVMATMHFDSVLLGHYSYRDVGAYTAATRILMVLTVLNGGVCHALFPKIIAAQATGDRAQIGRLVNWTVRAFLILFGGIAIGAAFTGEGLMHALYGARFTQTGTVFRLVSPMILMTALYSVLGQTLEILGEQRKVMAVYAVTAALNIGGNFLLIPWFGMYGSVAALLLSTLVMTILLASSLARNQKLVFLSDGIGRALLFLGVLAVLYIPLALLSVWMAVPLGALIFAALLFSLRGFWLKNMGAVIAVSVPAETVTSGGASG